MSRYSQYGVPSINSSLKLIPIETKLLCNNARITMKSENETLFNMVSVINMFIQTTKLKGTAWENIKCHYNDNITVIRGQINANDLAMKDYKTLSESVGSEKLIAEEIYEDIDCLIDRIEEYEDIIESYRRSIIDYIFPWGYYAKIIYYRGLIANCKETIKVLAKKLTKLQNIQDSTSGLFKEVIDLYKIVSQGIAAIDTSWTGTEFKPLSNEKWAIDLNERWRNEYSKEYSKYCVKDINGDKEYNWEAIEDLFEKDPSEVSGVEYQIICDLYSEMDDEDIETFFACAYVPYGENESGLNPNIEYWWPAAQYYKLSPVFKNAMEQFNNSIESLVVTVNYPFSEVNDTYDFKKLEKLIAKSSLATNLNTYCGQIARDGADLFEFETKYSKSRYEWLKPVQDIKYHTDFNNGTYGYSVTFNDGVTFAGEGWNYDMAHKIFAESHGIKSGDFAQEVTNQQVCDYLNGLVKSNLEIAGGITKDVVFEVLGDIGCEVIDAGLKADFVLGLFADAIENNRTAKDVKSLTRSINVSEIM